LRIFDENQNPVDMHTSIMCTAMDLNSLQGLSYIQYIVIVTMLSMCYRCSWHH